MKDTVPIVYMLILHGMVPLDFGKGIIIPLTKNSYGDKTSCDI